MNFDVDAACPFRCAVGLRVIVEKISIIDRLDFASVDFFDIAARKIHSRATPEGLLYIDRQTRIAPRSAGVVNADRFVHFDLAVHCFGRRERDFAERNADVGMNFSADINLPGIRQRG